ncbi:hypothetical protein QBC40DRAFT_302701 [Triangularia verruculosa]|uniref:Uncharacterized protein n=1 Tax=Triangularia verruculosa TaxID=2587418 RepID=A0AAN7AZJ7_9PEZI|nr:hypothetical protein QBC40DRAFT_302701 [Triangularia verruculosa]
MENEQTVDLEWLADLSKGQSFTTFGQSQSAKTLDFGSEGFTASQSESGELLQLTRPDSTCGLVFVRGQYPDNAASILARAQSGGPWYAESNRTFGTEIIPWHRKPSFSGWNADLNARRTQGWVNFRWPYAQHGLSHWESEHLESEHWESEHIHNDRGSCDTISFIKDGILFQICRLNLGLGSSTTSRERSEQEGVARANLKLGGPVRFGCPCSQSPSDILQSDNFTITDNGITLACRSNNYRARLEMTCFVNGVPQKPTPSGPHDAATEGQWVDLTSEHIVDIRSGEATYVVSTYALRADDEAQHDPTLPSDVADYLGVSRESVNMTDRLWTALCSTNYEAIEAVQFCVIGRGAEQILGVTSVPIVRSSRADEFPETALIGNIMTYQLVDVESVFYQIRLLAKLHRFIETRDLKKDFFNQYLQLEKIRADYLQKLTEAIQSALAWLFVTDLKPGRLLLAVPNNATDSSSSERFQHCVEKRSRLTWDTSYNRGCYATMAAWYVYSTCPSAFSRRFTNEIIFPRLGIAYQLGMERASRDKQPTPKSNVLQWLHLSSIVLLCVGLSAENRRLEFDIDEVRDAQEKAEKHVSRLKTNHAGGWKTHHDELDRVLLVAEEMGLDRLSHNSRSYALAVSRVKQAKQRIRDRRRTVKFSPGPKPWMTVRGLSNGPWELQCIHHEAYLRVADIGNVPSARDRLFEFLVADYSFMTSWDWADNDMIGRWWDLRPVAMICATLLDLMFEGKLQAAEPKKFSTHADDDAPQPFGRRTDTLKSDDLTASEILMHQTFKAAGDHATSDATRTETLIFKLLQTIDDSHGNDDSKSFDWLSHRPTTICFPDWYTIKVVAPSSHEGSFGGPDSTLRDLVMDIPMLRRYLPQQLDTQTISPFAIMNSDEKCEDLSLMSFWDIGFDSRIKGFSCRARDVLPTASYRNYLDKNIAMKKRLNNRLVDLGIKHRIFAFEALTPFLLSGFSYLWQPAAKFRLSDHLSSISRFTESKQGWITSISISYWALRSYIEVRRNKRHALGSELHGQSGIFPPDSIAQFGPASGLLRGTMEEQSSSIIFTGTPDGRLWICSVISPTIKDLNLSQLISNHARPALDRFIHQPSTARCLVFLMLLGHLCETLAVEYDKILTRLDGIIEIRNRTLIDGPEDWWGTAEAITKLKKMLWGWDALRIFNDKLSASLTQIQRAYDTTENHIKQDALHQEAELVQASNAVLDEFRKRLGMLVEVHDKIQLKIKQVTGLRDGISTITNVVDAQTALADNKTTIQQGNNIRTLTYITIGYLPLGFVTGLYSVQHGTFMNSATDWQFGVMIVLFSAGTWVLAYVLEKALVQVDWNIVKGHLDLKLLHWRFKLRTKPTRDRGQDPGAADDGIPLADAA